MSDVKVLRRHTRFCLGLIAVGVLAASVSARTQSADTRIFSGRWTIDTTSLSGQKVAPRLCRVECELTQSNDSLVIRFPEGQTRRIPLDGKPEVTTVSGGEFKTQLITTSRWDKGTLVITQVSGAVTSTSTMSITGDRIILEESRPGLDGGVMRLRAEYRRK